MKFASLLFLLVPFAVNAADLCVEDNILKCKELGYTESSCPYGGVACQYDTSLWYCAKWTCEDGRLYSAKNKPSNAECVETAYKDMTCYDCEEANISYSSCQDWDSSSYLEGNEPEGSICEESTAITLNDGTTVNCLTNCSLKCSDYPYTECPDGAINCSTCTHGSTTKYKVEDCDEDNGYYYSDGVCKPRDCSDYPLNEKPLNSTTYATADSNNSTHPGGGNTICKTAGITKYQLWICGSYNTHTPYYIPSGKHECQLITCSHFGHKTAPANAMSQQCRNKSAANPYILTSCKSGYYFKDDECIKIPDELCKKNHPYTSCPTGAQGCTMCQAGSNKYYSVKFVDEDNYFVDKDGNFVAKNGDFVHDNPFASAEECFAAFSNNANCYKETDSATGTSRYHLYYCDDGYHFDGKQCVANDCSDYTHQRPNTNASYLWGKYYSHDYTTCKYGSSIGDAKFLLQRCANTYKLKGNDCVSVTDMPDEFVSKYRGCGIYDEDYNEYTGSQYDGYVLGSISNCSKEWYDYIRGCQPGYHWNGTKCIANKCPDFPFSSSPANAKTVASCHIGASNGKYTTMYRAKSCEEGYRLNNHGCEKIE